MMRWRSSCVVQVLTQCKSFPSRSRPVLLLSKMESTAATAYSEDLSKLFTAFEKHKVSKKNFRHENVVSALESLVLGGFFRQRNQERAKYVFQKSMEHVGLSTAYVTAGGWDYSEDMEGDLDPSLFCWTVTKGIQKDIRNAEGHSHQVNLFSVASQYNAAEAPSPFTPGIGCAMAVSEGDQTQGPMAQRTNPPAFEFVTAFLTQLGFNMMNEVLPSAGKVYEKDASIAHGYLRPTDATIEKLSEEMEANFSLFEAPSYESRPTGQQPVYLMLGAAPALGYSGAINDKYSDHVAKLQYWAYVANFTALLKRAQMLSVQYPDKEIIVHVVLIGLGVFRCDRRAFAAAFKQAGLRFQQELAKQDGNKNVSVQVGIYGRGAFDSIVNREDSIPSLLGLSKKET